MFCAISCSPEKSCRSSTALTRLVRHKMQSAIWKKVTRAERWSSLQNEMTTSKIDNSQRIAAKVAGIAGLLTFVLVVVMLWLVAPLNSLGALRLLSDSSYLQVFEPQRLQALARVQIAASFDDYYVGLPFFGLAATVCAWLWFRSNYIPKGLAIFGIIASAWCVLCALIYLIFPHFNKVVNDYIFDSPLALFELIVSFWLLFKGLKPVPLNQSQADAL